MCTLAAEETSTWLMVDPWEARQTEYQRTAVVLDHFDHEINTVLGGVLVPTDDGGDGGDGDGDGEEVHQPVQVMLLAGSDLISTMSEPGVWSEADVSAPSPSSPSRLPLPLPVVAPRSRATARPHPRALRHLHRRARGRRHGPGD